MRVTITRRNLSQGAALTVALAAVGGVTLTLAGPRTHEIRIHGFAFAPSDLTIAQGDVVVWKNADFVPHTATAVTGDWNTGEIAADAVARVTFEESGEHGYFCAYHPQMTGRIRVALPG